MCRVRPRGMLGGFDTNVAVCVIKPKKFVCYEQKFLRQLLVMFTNNTAYTHHKFFITVPKLNCRKVMFFTSVCEEFCPLGGGCTWQGAYVAGGHAWQRSMHGGGRGACVAGETATAADGTHPTGMHSRE